MIYIISTVHNKEGDIRAYIGFDTLSDSTMSLSVNYLKNILLNNKILVVNASIEDEDIILKAWPHGLASNQNDVYGVDQEPKYLGPAYVLIAADYRRYKIVNCKNGYGSYVIGKDFKDLVMKEQITNCAIVGSKNGDKILMTDVCILYRDDEFEKLIKTKYEEFQAKTHMLGCGGITFKYIIEDREVKITQYTGSSKAVILPPFITSILRGAFSGFNLESIEFNEGLRSIGTHSFRYNNLRRIEIPESVEILGVGAFSGNKKLFRDSYYMDTDRVKLRNQDTIVLDQSVE